MTSRPSSDQTWQPIDGRVALIAPASAIATDVLEATLRQLEVHGVDYHLGRHVEARYRYLAGTVEQRLEDLHNAFDMPDITAVWCLRGGYGCGQLLPGLDWAPAGGLAAATDRFLRHLGVAQRFPPPRPACDPRPGGHRTRSVAAERPREQQERLASLASVSRLLAGIDHELPVQHLGGHKQRVEGALIGGNLTALACMAGTLGGLHAPAGSILVLEDVGEPYYRLERSLWQLLESIDARQLGAICLGSFTDCPRKEVAHSLERIFGEYAAAIEVPLYHHLPSGHGAQNRAWPYGKTAVLEGNRLRW